MSSILPDLNSYSSSFTTDTLSRTRAKGQELKKSLLQEASVDTVYNLLHIVHVISLRRVTTLSVLCTWLSQGANYKHLIPLGWKYSSILPPDVIGKNFQNVSDFIAATQYKTELLFVQFSFVLCSRWRRTMSPWRSLSWIVVWICSINCLISNPYWLVLLIVPPLLAVTSSTIVKSSSSAGAMLFANIFGRTPRENWDFGKVLDVSPLVRIQCIIKWKEIDV